ncbi:MAG: hypothetical protein Q9159_001923 [Coniocarpon cinnabarinum]
MERQKQAQSSVPLLAPAIHRLASDFAPTNPFKSKESLWVAVLNHNVSTINDIKDGKAFLWIKANPLITVRTVKFKYFERFPLDEVVLQHGWKILPDNTPVGSLRGEFRTANLVAFRALVRDDITDKHLLADIKQNEENDHPRRHGDTEDDPFDLCDDDDQEEENQRASEEEQQVEVMEQCREPDAPVYLASDRDSRAEEPDDNRCESSPELLVPAQCPTMNTPHYQQLPGEQTFHTEIVPELTQSRALYAPHDSHTSPSYDHSTKEQETGLCGECNDYFPVNQSDMLNDSLQPICSTCSQRWNEEAFDLPPPDGTACIERSEHKSQDHAPTFQADGTDCSAHMMEIEGHGAADPDDVMGGSEASFHTAEGSDQDPTGTSGYVDPENPVRASPNFDCGSELLLQGDPEPQHDTTTQHSTTEPSQQALPRDLEPQDSEAHDISTHATAEVPRFGAISAIEGTTQHVPQYMAWDAQPNAAPAEYTPFVASPTPSLLNLPSEDHPMQEQDETNAQSDASDSLTLVPHDDNEQATVDPSQLSTPQADEPAVLAIQISPSRTIDGKKSQITIFREAHPGKMLSNISRTAAHDGIAYDTNPQAHAVIAMSPKTSKASKVVKLSYPTPAAKATKPLNSSNIKRTSSPVIQRSSRATRAATNSSKLTFYAQEDAAVEEEESVVKHEADEDSVMQDEEENGSDQGYEQDDDVDEDMDDEY